MPELFPYFLFLHVLGAIVAFGPSFAAPLVGVMAGREPGHANFAARLNLLLATRLTVPFALSLAVTGIGMIWSRSIDLVANRWLGIAIVLYVIALAVSLTIQIPNVRRLASLTSSPPPAGASGPPPEVPALVGRIRRTGMILTVLVIAILFLMVVRPSI